MTKLFKRMDVCTERMIKQFERMIKPFERMQFFSERMTKLFERMDVSTEQIDQAIWTDANFFEWMTQAYPTGANLFWTVNKQLVNGIPFENGKPLVYVFAWEVTNMTFLYSKLREKKLNFHNKK